VISRLALGRFFGELIHNWVLQSLFKSFSDHGDNYDGDRALASISYCKSRSWLRLY
jgi:hypothetical protein